VLALLADPVNETMQSQISSLVEELQDLKELHASEQQNLLELLNSSRQTMKDFEE